MSRPVITLTTDFGQVDGYVAAIKAVILGICPEAVLVDVSHEIAPQDVRQAAYILSTVVPYFPPGTVHLVVVDPGVGSARRAVIVVTERAVYVAPDNGLLDLTLTLSGDFAQQAIHLRASGAPSSHPISATFHGRDLFAPAAARLACGAHPHDLGDPIPVTDLVALPAFRVQLQPDGSWLGQVLHVDRFGNLVTNFRFPLASPQGMPTDFIDAGPDLLVHVSGTSIAGPSRTFSDVAPGELLTYVGSSGYLEIAVREGSAAARLGVGVGDPVSAQRKAGEA